MASTDVIVDASFFLSAWFDDGPNHARASRWYETTFPVLVTTPVVIAELDHLVRRFGGKPAERLVIANVATKALEVEWWEGAVQAIFKLVDDRPDIGIADASLVALAAHRRTTRIATFDERHFRDLRPLTGEDAFTLVPLDGD